MIERYPAMFVIATAGAGKTTALVQAAALIDRPLAWVTAGDGDVAPHFGDHAATSFGGQALVDSLSRPAAG